MTLCHAPTTDNEASVEIAAALVSAPTIGSEARVKTAVEPAAALRYLDFHS